MTDLLKRILKWADSKQEEYDVDENNDEIEIRIQWWAKRSLKDF